MKTLVLTLTFALNSVFIMSQTAEWTKDDRSSVFDECMSSTSKYKNLSKDQKESLSLCYLNEITSKYSKKEYQSKIDIEIKRIQQATITLCAKNIGVILENENAESAEKTLNTSKINEGNFTRNNIIGVWRDENSKIFFNEDATFLIKWDNGEAASGKWWINEIKEIVMENYSTLKIVSINEKEFKYEQVSAVKKNLFGKIKETSTSIYTATRVD